MKQRMKITKEEILKDTIKRELILWQLHRYSLNDIRESETLKEYSKAAKSNKSFVDLRICATDLLRSMDSYMFKVKKSMQIDTYNAIMNTLNSDQVREISLLMDELTELSATAIEKITISVKEAKVNAGIPLNNSH